LVYEFFTFSKIVSRSPKFLTPSFLSEFFLLSCVFLSELAD
jgi:hypothetical protein